MIPIQRRSFLNSTATGLGLAGLLRSLGPLRADETAIAPGIARFSSEIEPLVRFLEDTPRDKVIEETARRIKSGLSYRQLLAALLLAGVRNVQPRPSVGFKFHAVLVVNSAHLASLSGLDEERWLPILWAVDNLKGSQARDEQEGNWTLPAVDEAALPSAANCASELRRALEQWDEAAADTAITSVVRELGANHVFDLLAEYAARDFRSIGHKVIYLSNAFRTLQTIGWEYAEPVARSLVYALLNHNGEPNPASGELAPDASGKMNWQRVASLKEFHSGAGQGTNEADDAATQELVQTLHNSSPDEASGQVIELLGAGVSTQAIWDGLFASAGELLMRQPGIVALHAVTTTNAMRYAFATTGQQATRKFLLLQNASFLSHFRLAAEGRGELRDLRITDLASQASAQTLSQAPPATAAAEAFDAMGSSRVEASQQAYDYLAAGGDPQSIVDHARRLVFLKGDDSHDYKFSSAALEDYRGMSPQWRNRFLAASMVQLCSPHQATRPLVQRIVGALS
ncbi:MAG: hypothetical protein IT422_14135 [Pirellulaceae bacterium]|nr:hypothetical protein [Pirellulaceae bacterium]